jgi:glutamate dehydrogenase (NAD(P)+)
LSFEDTNCFFGGVMDVTNVGRGIEELLVTSNRPGSVKVPLEMEDRHVRVFQGHGVHHNNARGPYQGLRCAPDVALEAGPGARLADDVGGDARAATYGGAKGGLAIDIKELNRGTLEEISTFTAEGTLSGGDVVLGFECPVAEVFE